MSMGPIPGIEAPAIKKNGPIRGPLNALHYNKATLAARRPPM
jgi:hypothetical protein